MATCLKGRSITLKSSSIKGSPELKRDTASGLSPHPQLLCLITRVFFPFHLSFFTADGLPRFFAPNMLAKFLTVGLFAGIAASQAKLAKTYTGWNW